MKILTFIEFFPILKRLKLSNKIIEMYRVIGKDYINTMEREFYLRCSEYRLSVIESDNMELISFESAKKKVLKCLQVWRVMFVL